LDFRLTEDAKTGGITLLRRVARRSIRSAVPEEFVSFIHIRSAAGQDERDGTKEKEYVETEFGVQTIHSGVLLRRAAYHFSELLTIKLEPHRARRFSSIFLERGKNFVMFRRLFLSTCDERH
jgi:hypothetical protein